MLSERFASTERARLGHLFPREIIAEYSRARSLFTLRGFTAALFSARSNARARERAHRARVVEVLPIRFASFDRRTFHLQQRYYLSRVSRFSYPLLLLLLLLLLFLLPLAGHIPVSHSHYVPPPPPPRADVRSCWNAMQRKRMAHGGQKSRITPVFYLAAALFRRSVSPRDLARRYRYVCHTHLPIHLSQLSVQYTPPVVHARSS